MTHRRYPARTAQAGTALLLGLLIALPAVAGLPDARPRIAAEVATRLAGREAVEALVLLDDAEVEAAEGRAARGRPPLHRLARQDYLRRMEARMTRLDAVKDRLRSEVADPDLDVLGDYSLLPVLHVRLHSARALERLARHAGVLAVDENRRNAPMLAQSLPLIGQPEAWQAGHGGEGTSIAVLDTGVDYTRAVFGACSAPGGDCKVAYARDFAPADGVADDNGHGSHVAAIALGVAPAARILALDVFRSSGYAYDSDILAAINWCVANRAAYGIAAINLSLGAGRYKSAIAPTDAWGKAVQAALEAGIVVAAAAGNSAYTNALSSPAAYGNVVSVGAVYDSDLGTQKWSLCADTSTRADKVTCWSNSAAFLTLLAPGARIAAADAVMSGTSQATPHVAGAAAVLRAAFPDDTAAQIAVRLRQGPAVRDARNGVVKPRVDLVDALNSHDKAILVTSVSPADGGSVEPALGAYARGTAVTLLARPKTGLDFAGWSGDCAGTAPQCVLTMDAHKTVTASFGAATAATPLANGEAVEGLAADAGAASHYYIDVPAGRDSLRVETWGGNGNADLYVRRDAQPTIDTYDCRSWQNGNTEVCTFSAPVEGRYHVMLHAYAAYDGLGLRASHAAASAQTLQFGAASYTVSEGKGSVTLPVLRGGGTDGTATVQYATVNGTALAGSDYVARSGTLSLAPGVASQDVVISLTNDSLYEADETFTVSLASPAGASLGTNASAMVTITNDDKNIEFETVALTVGEGDGSVTLRVRRLGSTAAAASVSYATANGTAVSGSDYSSRRGTLKWSAGDGGVKAIVVPILNNTAGEASETFKVNLSAPYGATLGAARSAVITIVDDD